MKMNESGNTLAGVPLSRVLRGGTAGQREITGTASGTLSGTLDLKTLAVAKLGGTASGTGSGTPGKMLSRCPERSGTVSGGDFERNRQVLVGRNPQFPPVEKSSLPSAAPAFSPPWPPPPAPALHCFACSCWQRVTGLAWWSGRCAVTGREITMRSRCDRGFEEWQASPLPERTAPQPRGGEQC